MLRADAARAPTERPTAGLDAVVVGASAGGVEAIGILLAALPHDFAPAVVVVIHVPAANQNLLVQVLAPRCALVVQEAGDKEAVRGGIVYIAPPGYHLLVEPDRSFALSADAPVNYSRPSIDVLFESAAYAYRDRLLGIVLTGANADGADGLAQVRAFGGRAWVQEPDTAVATMMPASAIERAGADRILTLPDMAAALAALQPASFEP
jgi:two-component system chemotaxis response regulator CheB